MAIYDADNRQLGHSNPLKLTLRSGTLNSSTWEIPLATLASGIYRVDVSLGDGIVWRKFFRMTD